jgi:hypothetical protein
MKRKETTLGGSVKSVLCQRGAQMKIGPRRGMTLRVGCPVGIPVVVVVVVVVKEGP